MHLSKSTEHTTMRPNSDVRDGLWVMVHSGRGVRGGGLCLSAEHGLWESTFLLNSAVNKTARKKLSLQKTGPRTIPFTT